MGLSLCKPCCRCCPCCCRGEDVRHEIPARSPPPDAKKANAMGSVFYRSHSMDPNFPSALERQLDGEDNGAFTRSNEAPPRGGPEPPNDGRSAPRLAVPVYTVAPGNGRNQRLEALRTQVSTHSYKPRSHEDLEVRKGEEVEVLEERGTWIFAKTLNADGEAQTGYVPRTFLANAGSLEAEEL